MAREQARKGEGDWRPSGRVVRQWARHVGKLRDGIRNRGRKEDVPLCIVLRAEDVSKFLTVSDGDGFVAAGLRIRLLGMDAPEIEQACLDEVRIHDVDCYGRLLATCHVGGRDVGETMVREGLAVCYRSDRYKEAEREALRHRRGMWKGAHQTPESWRRCHRDDDRKRDAPDGMTATASKAGAKRNGRPRRKKPQPVPAACAEGWTEVGDAFRQLLRRARNFGADVGDDAYEAPFAAQIHEGADGEIERFRIQASEALVDEHGFQPYAAGMGLHHIRKSERQRQRGKKAFAAGKRAHGAFASGMGVENLQIQPAAHPSVPLLLLPAQKEAPAAHQVEAAVRSG